MGSGPRFQIIPIHGVSLGFRYYTFPFKYTFDIDLLFVTMSIGIGAAYND